MARKQRKGKRGTCGTIVIVVIVLFIIIGVIGSCAGGGDKSSDSASTATTTSSIAETKPTSTATTEATTEKSLVDAVKEATAGSVGEGESITDISLDGKTLKITVDLSKADTSVVSARDIAFNRISSITDPILALDDSYYDQWDTIVIDFGTEGKATLDKSMVVDDPQIGKYFDVSDDSILKTDSSASTSSSSNSVTTIDITAGELGDYGQELVLNEGTEFEDKTIGYFVPTGKYKVTNIGDYPTQVNVYKNEKVKNGDWEEWADGTSQQIAVGASVEITVNDGYFVNVDEPSHITLEKEN